eukprot:COSAG04_NODE_550_length_12709_cov_6.177637_8_plen_267_part_00
MAAALPHRRRLRAVRAALCAGSDEPRPPGWPELRKSATPSRDHPLPPLGLSAEIEFHERGFIVVRKLIPEQMCERMMQGYQRAIEGGRDRKPNDPEGEPLLMQVGGRGRDGTGQPEWEGIPYLERIVAVGKQLMGDDMDFAYDQIIYKPPGTSVELLWHQDAGYGWPGQANARGMTSWLALSPATEAMGSLHFVPGSHKGGIVEHFDCSDWNPVGGALQAAVPEEAGVLVEYEIGDVSRNTPTAAALSCSAPLAPSLLTLAPCCCR